MSDGPSIPEFPSGLLNTILGFQTSQVIITAVTSGIFDALEAAEGKKASAEYVSSRLDLNEECTGRLLRMCVNIGLLTVDNDAFMNSEETSRYLTSASDQSISAFVKRIGHQYEELEKVCDAVKHGQKAVAPEDIMYAGQVNPEKIEYNNCMMRLAAPALVNAFDLSRYKSACDMAGGVGEFARALKRCYPSMEVSVMEQSGMVDFAYEKGYHELDNIPIDFIKGDMLTSKLPDMDLFILGHVCMYMDDGQLKQFFQRIYLTLPAGGSLMVCESLLNPDKCGPLLTLQRDIAELVVASGGERSAEEYTGLLTHAGFQDIKFHVFEQPNQYDIVLATK